MNAPTLALAATPLAVIAQNAAHVERRGRWTHFDLVVGTTVANSNDLGAAVHDLTVLGLETKVLEGDGIWAPGLGVWHHKPSRKYRRVATIKVAL